MIAPAACLLVSTVATGPVDPWLFLTIGQNPGVSAAPSSGLLRFATDEFDLSVYTSNPFLLSATAATWAAERDQILASSWIGVDVQGGPGAWTLGDGVRNRPAYSETNNNADYPYILSALPGSGFQAVTGGTSTGIAAGSGGWGFAPQRPDGSGQGMAGIVPVETDLPLDVLGRNLDGLQSVFVGHFALTDADAVLAGEFTISTRKVAGPSIGSNAGYELNLDGTPQNFGDYFFALAQVRGPGNTIDLYVVEGVPTPGACVVIGIAGVCVVRRRR